MCWSHCPLINIIKSQFTQIHHRQTHTRTEGLTPSVCDLGLFTKQVLYVISVLFRMLTTILKHTFQNGGQGQEAAKGFQEKHLCFSLCPRSWENDLNNGVGIDDIRDQRHK